MTSKRFKDYPLSFWAGVIASLTTASLAIASYSGMIADGTAFFKAVALVVSFELGLIIAMATFAGKLQGLLKGWALVVLLLISLAEIFMTSMEIQGGVAKQGANASNYQQSSANLGAVANGMASATKALADCDKRYPRKVKDAKARDECRKPYENIVSASTGAMPADNNAPKYDESAAGQLIQWQSVADALNAAWQPVTPITWSQAAFYILTLIMALLILIKNFFWAKYAHDVELAAHDNLVVVDESNLGTVGTVTEQPHTPTTEPVKRQFGFAPSTASPSSAEAVRASLQPCNSTVYTERHCNSPVYTEQTYNSAVSALDAAKAAKIGSVVHCPQCGTQFVKNSHNHLYCSNNRKPRRDGGNCSDDWHNSHNPERAGYLLKRKH